MLHPSGEFFYWKKQESVEMCQGIVFVGKADAK
jgi:hypothetical protein